MVNIDKRIETLYQTGYDQSQISGSMLTVEMGLPVLTPIDATLSVHAYNILNRYLRALYVDLNITVDNTAHYYSSIYTGKKIVSR